MKYIGSEKHLKNAEKARLIGLEKIAEYKKERINEYYINPNKCHFCNEALKYKRKNAKFCNSSCAAKYNNTKRVLSDKTKKLIGEKLKGKEQTKERKLKTTGDKNGRWKGGICTKEYITNRKCKICGNEFIVKKISKDRLSRSKCCSIECQNKDASNRMKQKASQGLLNGWSTRNIISYPEKFFINVLNDNNIQFKHNYPVNKRSLSLTDSCNYFLDFFIENKRIDLEIDGKQHKYRKEHDDERDKLLNEYGYIVYRIKWKNINTEMGKQYIKNEIDKFMEFYDNN